MNPLRILILSVSTNLPCFLLCCLPLLPKLKCKRKTLYLIIAANVLGISLYYILREYFFPQYRWVDTVTILFFYVIYIYQYWKCFDVDLSKLIYVFLIVQAYSNILNIASKYLSVTLFPAEATMYAAPSYNMFILIFLTVSYPFMFYLLKYKMRPALDELSSRSFWQLCITPVLFFVIHMIYVNLFSRSNYQDKEMIAIYILIIIVGIIIYIVSLSTALDATKAARLKSEIESLQLQMEFQAQNYAQLIESIETSKKVQHDMRHHLAVINAYIENDEKQVLKDYLEQYMKQLPSDIDTPICSNYAVDAVVRHYLAALKDVEVDIDIKLRFTGVEGISDAVLCILFGNLIENSVNSILRQKSDHKFIHAECSVIADKFMIMVDNSCDEHELKKQGIGQRSIIAVAEAYQGTARFELKDHVYRNSVMLKLKG